jgi:hypothetical protein
LLILEFAKGMAERFWFPDSATITRLLVLISNRDFVQSSIACVGGLPTRAS